MLICFSTTLLWYNKPKNHTDVLFITWLWRKSRHLLGFQNQNSIRITEGSDNGDSDNGDSDNQGSTVHHCSGTMVRTQQAIGELLHLVI